MAKTNSLANQLFYTLGEMGAIKVSTYGSVRSISRGKIREADSLQDKMET